MPFHRSLALAADTSSRGADAAKYISDDGKCDNQILATFSSFPFSLDSNCEVVRCVAQSGRAFKSSRAFS